MLTQCRANGTPGGINDENGPISTQAFSFSGNMVVIDVMNGVWNGDRPARSGSFATFNNSGCARQRRP